MLSLIDDLSDCTHVTEALRTSTGLATASLAYSSTQYHTSARLAFPQWENQTPILTVFSSRCKHSKRYDVIKHRRKTFKSIYLND